MSLSQTQLTWRNPIVLLLTQAYLTPGCWEKRQPCPLFSFSRASLSSYAKNWAFLGRISLQLITWLHGHWSQHKAGPRKWSQGLQREENPKHHWPKTALPLNYEIIDIRSYFINQSVMLLLQWSSAIHKPHPASNNTNENLGFRLTTIFNCIHSFGDSAWFCKKNILAFSNYYTPFSRYIISITRPPMNW